MVQGAGNNGYNNNTEISSEEEEDREGMKEKRKGSKEEGKGKEYKVRWGEMKAERREKYLPIHQSTPFQSYEYRLLLPLVL